MIIVRCDSSYQIGTGHILRCLQLAKELRRAGLAVHFVCTELDGHASSFVRAENFALTMLAPGTSVETEVSVIKNLRPSWLIVDHYMLDREWELHFQGTAPVFAIDDLANRPHAAEVLLDQNYHSKNDLYDGLMPSGCRLYLGPQFALLKPELLNYTVVAKEPLTVLCFFGGTDSTGETLKLAYQLASSPKSPLNFKIVAGEKNANLTELKLINTDHFELYVQPENWIHLLASSTLYLGSGGIVTWERMFLGVAGAVISVAENQRQISEDLARDGYQSYLGSSKNLNYAEVVAQVEKLMQQPTLLTKMAIKARSLVRPFPAELLKSLFVQPAETDFILKHAEMNDAEFLLDVRNDPLTRAMSKNHDPVSPDAHLAWLSRKVAEKNARLYVAYANGARCGQFRIDADLSVSVSLHPDFRGKTLAPQIISAGSRLFRTEFPCVTSLTAEILDENTASKKSFESADYKLTKAAADNNGHAVYQWVPSH